MKAWIKLSLTIVAVLVILTTGYAGLAAAAENPAAFYKGKVIKFIVPFTPGGLYDIYVRYAAPSLEKYTGATVVVENMPGAGGLKAINYVYNVAKPNGLTLLISHGSMLPLNKVLNIREAKYELEPFNWIARIHPSFEVIFTGAKSPYRSVNDLRAAKRIKFGASGVWAYTGIGAALAAEGLGLPNATIISGYPGGSQIEMAVLTGEADIASKSGESMKDSIESGDFRPIVQLSKTRAAYLPDTPTIYEVGITGKAKQWIDWWINLTANGRILLTSPGVPKERVEFLRAAIKKTLFDKEFTAKCEKDPRDMTVGYLSGPELYKQALQSTSLSKEQAKELRYIIGEKYYK